MSRGFGSHQRHILDALRVRGCVWLTELPSISRADATSFYRAARRLETQGHVRVEYRHRTGVLARRVLLVSVKQSPTAIALPLDAHGPCWGDHRAADRRDHRAADRRAGATA